MKRPFCGRREELDELRRAYRDVAWSAHGGPALVAIVAESGLGKTRLVQEFYRWLASSEDGGSGYWPGDLAAVDDNLQINPDPAACDGTRPVPFLWWGLRLPDPGARNQAVAGQLSSSLDALTPHLEPALRTERRRQAGKGMAMAAGNVALDFALNLIPAVGVLKTLGQGAIELGQHARTLWRDDAATPGDIHGQQREGLAARIVSDLGLLLSRDAADTPAVPAVIVVDDGQFSEHDPSIVTCLEKLLAAAVSGRWRVLFVVTYWTAEWNQHFRADETDRARTIGRVLHAAQAAFGESWRSLHLPPVRDLSPIVAPALPGLEPAQAEAILERAGGNPRYLDEILRYCERNERLFVGRNLAAPLTGKGLATLLERTVDLHELVEERLRLLEPDVRRALLLASAQGQEFLVPLVAEVSGILQDGGPVRSESGPYPRGESAGESELGRAEHPHAFIRRHAECLGAFTQRVFHEVAVAQIGNEFDEDDVQEALRDALRRRLDAFEALLDADEATRVRTCLMASDLLAGSADGEDVRRTTLALMHLVHTYQQRHDHELAWQFGDRLAARLSDADPSRTPGYPYHVAASTLIERGRFREARGLLDTGLVAQRRLAAGEPGAPHDDVLALLLGAASRCARAEGRLDAAEACLSESCDIRRRAAAASGDLAARRDLLVSCLDAGHLAKELGRLVEAEVWYEEAYTIARELDDRQATRQSGADLVLAQVALGDTAFARGDIHRAASLYDQGHARSDDRTTGVADTDPTAQERRAVVLERVGRTALAKGDPEGASVALEEVVALRRRLAERINTAEAHVALANALRQLGDVHWDRQDVAAAWQAFADSLDAAGAATAPEHGAFARRVRSLALERMGRVALLLDDFDVAEHIFEQRLEMDHETALALGTAAAWRDVLTSNFWLADIAEQRGAAEAAEARFATALTLARDLLAHQGTPAAREDVRGILTRLAPLARARGDEAFAAACEAEATDLAVPPSHPLA